MLDIAIQFAWGLHYSHEQGLIHQDVKPGNVMITSDGIAKVTDFGLARAKPMSGPAEGDGNQTMMAQKAGIFLLVSLMLLACYNDILRILGKHG